MPMTFRPVAASLLTGLLACGTALAQDAGPSDATDPGAAPAASGGWVAYLDPATGKLVDRPPYGKSTLQLSKEELYMFSTDDFGLIERKMPDGGYAIDLQGRFQHGTVATIGDDGELNYSRISGDMYASPTGLLVKKALRREILDESETEDAR